MARYLSGSASRLPLTWTCRQLSTSASSRADVGGLADLEAYSVAQSAKPDESVIQSFKERKRDQRSRPLPGNRFVSQSPCSRPPTGPLS